MMGKYERIRNLREDRDYNRTPEWKEKMKDLNSSEEHKKKCNETRRKNINEKQR